MTDAEAKRLAFEKYGPEALALKRGADARAWGQFGRCQIHRIRPGGRTMLIGSGPAWEWAFIEADALGNR